MSKLDNGFYLQVQHVETSCLFLLTWGSNQRITASIAYPDIIASSFNKWRLAYENFYRRKLRGKLVNAGCLETPVDWQGELVQTKAKLLYEFHQWLRSGELYEIRSTISNLATTSRCINVFISCNTSQLTHLPWEAWEISTEITGTKIRIARQPLNIHQSVTEFKHHSGKARVLAIFGDNSGLNFDKEKQAILSLKKQLEVQFICYESGKSTDVLKSEITEALNSKQGWDILFFAGHSNETTLTGGQISIAPYTTLSLTEIEKPLTTAIKNGLRFAFFNSCDGLSIANKLVDLGLSQVAIMREPIHNQVAEEVFVQFLTNIAQYKDVHESLLLTSEYLKVEKNLTYPSAYLVLSLFRNPGANLFRLQPFGIRHIIKQWLPRRREALGLSTLLVLSLLPPVQEAVLNWQVGLQAIYRDVTKQIPPAPEKPPVLIVQVDEKSLNQANIQSSKFSPIDRSYIAYLVDKLSIYNPKIISFDYLFDRATNDKDDKMLANSIENAIANNGTWFIFGTVLDDNNQKEVVYNKIANLNQSLKGYVDGYPGHLELLDQNSDCIQDCPFTYLIALTKLFSQEKPIFDTPQPKLSNNRDLRTKLVTYINSQQANLSITQLNKLRLHPLATASGYLRQTWLYPIVDYSIPRSQVYQVVSASNLLNNNIDNRHFQSQIVLIGAGGYDEAGLSKTHSDKFPLPMGVAYWRLKSLDEYYIKDLTGVEINAYMIQHLLKQHIIVPIPDMWMIGVAALLGKALQIILNKHQYKKRSNIFLLTSLASATGAYMLISMQMYISASIMAPIFLPSTAFWICILPSLRKQDDA